MDYQMPRESTVQRLRTERVVRRIQRARFGTTTRNYHRNQRVQQVSFSVLTALLVLGALVLALS